MAIFRGGLAFHRCWKVVGMKWGGSQAGKRRKEGRTYGKQRPAQGGQ
jgi:hypothetical protein